MTIDTEAEYLRSQQQASAMRELKVAPQWDWFTNYLQRLITETIERILVGTPEEFKYYSGFVAGLRTAVAAPEVLIDYGHRLHQQRKGK